MKVISLILLSIMAMASCFSNKKSKTNHWEAGCNDTVNVQVNDTFSVKLAVAIGTAYRWEYADSTDLVRLLVPNPPVTQPDNANEEGGYGFQLFKWTAVRKGNIFLHFKYRRVFGQPTKYDDSCRVYLSVQ